MVLQKCHYALQMERICTLFIFQSGKQRDWGRMMNCTQIPDVRGHTYGWSSPFQLCCILWSTLEDFSEEECWRSHWNDAQKSQWTGKQKMAAITGVFLFLINHCSFFLLTPHITTNRTKWKSHNEYLEPTYVLSLYQYNSSFFKPECSL